MESTPIFDNNDEEPSRGISRTFSADSPRSMQLRRREQQQLQPTFPQESPPTSHHQRRPPPRRRSSNPNFMSSTGAATSHNNNRRTIWNCCLGGKSHLFVLFMGMMLGYLLLPVLLIEVQMSDFLDRSFPDEPIGMNPATAVRDVNYFLRTTESRALDGVSSNKKKKEKPPKDGNLLSESVGSGTTTDKVYLPFTASDVEQRLMEDHDVLSKQSVPTATTPYVMKTKVLPDHHRLKILVTGGAGFVGSHLVDKLMMEGHEVIVVDNFFTGQKRNIAHWLHHPLFR